MKGDYSAMVFLVKVMVFIIKIMIHQELHGDETKIFLEGFGNIFGSIFGA